MADDRPDGGAGSTDRSDPVPLIRLRLGAYAVTVERVRVAEAHYLEMAAGSSRRDAKARRGHDAAIAQALDRLAEAVVDLQETHTSVRELADDARIPGATLAELDESFEATRREYAGYLAARTYQQVRVAADDRAGRR